MAPIEGAIDRYSIENEEIPGLVINVHRLYAMAI